MPSIKKLLFLCLSFLLLVNVACKRTLSRAELQTQLRESMSQFLNQNANSDSAGIKFDVKDVNFFEDESSYICKFTVHMYKSNGYDTTGVMSAKISKDFKTVKRNY